MDFKETQLRLLKFVFLPIFSLFVLEGCSLFSRKTEQSAGVPAAAVSPSPSADVSDDSPQGLKKQILELQKAQGEQSSKIEELNNQISVLKDQVGNKQTKVARLVPPTEAPQPPAPAPIAAPVVASETKVDPLIPVAAPPKEEPKAKAGLTPVEKLYRQVVINSKNQKLDAAGKEVNLMLKQYRNSPLTNNALFLYAETLYEHENYAKSAEEFERLYKLFPDGNKAVAALYKLALSYQKLGHPTEAQEAFENIVTVYPGSREALDAQNQILNGNGKSGGQ